MKIVLFLFLVYGSVFADSAACHKACLEKNEAAYKKCNAIEDPNFMIGCWSQADEEYKKCYNACGKTDGESVSWTGN